MPSTDPATPRGRGRPRLALLAGQQRPVTLDPETDDQVQRLARYLGKSYSGTIRELVVAALKTARVRHQLEYADSVE